MGLIFLEANDSSQKVLFPSKKSQIVENPKRQGIYAPSALCDMWPIMRQTHLRSAEENITQFNLLASM